MPRALLTAAVLIAAACDADRAAPAPFPEPSPSSAVVFSAESFVRKDVALADTLIADVPFVRQKPDFCGEACAAAYLQKLGEEVDQDFVFDQSGLEPALGRGAYTRDLLQALERIGFDTGDPFTEADSDAVVGEAFRVLDEDLARGVPSIVCMRYDEYAPFEHFRLVLGYDAAHDEVVYHEPAEDDGAYRRMPRARFLSLWPIHGPRGPGLVRLRLEPKELLFGEISEVPTAADYAQAVMALKQLAPAGFSFAVEPPFVLASDLPRGDLAGWSARTVRFTVAFLRREYFPKDPPEILSIWLFRNAESYNRHARALFGHAPDTPYGYYSEEHKALVMNIATGGGTLIHEIVHPFLDANFPERPPWLSEGLASLYEGCDGDDDGRIRGLVNWRLPGLQAALASERPPSLAALLAMDAEEFYGEEGGANYAMARYLCYALQEKGLLARFYHAFRTEAADDPTGRAALEATVGTELDAFEREWRTFVLTL